MSPTCSNLNLSAISKLKVESEKNDYNIMCNNMCMHMYMCMLCMYMHSSE